ncbi:MAG TPA: TetR/AcrR family transcriptional regulator [Polyangiaceae bacterium]|nr:TetR/AcrR family transcriptional regulator [Polyangiaceae bacterium]
MKNQEAEQSQSLSSAAGPAARRTGGRSARVVRDVLAAALEVFAEQGYAGFSIDDVATRASVNKTTVYRRWPTKADLVGAALISLRDQDPEPPDTGSLRADLVALLHQRATQMGTPARRAIMQALLVSNSEPELLALTQKLRRERPGIPRVLFQRAVERGELPADVDVALMTEALFGAVLSRTWKRERVSHSFLTRLVDLVVAGAAAGAGRLRS